MKSVYIESILDKPVNERSVYLTHELRESQWFERKSIEVKPINAIKTIVAFANSEGGLLAIGCSNGEVRGLNYDQEFENKMRRCVRENIVPKVLCDFTRIEVINDAGKKDEILAIYTSPSEYVCEDSKGRCYIRSGDSSEEIKFRERIELECNKGVRCYDGEIIKTSDLSDIDWNLVSSYCDRIGYSGESLDKVLESRRLIDNEGHQTNACHLLFSKDPNDVFPQANIRITKFLTDERGAGRSLNIDSENDYRLDGNIPTLIQKSIEVMDKLVDRRTSLRDDGLFTPNYVIPRDAWMEGVVNALIHRSYSFLGDYVHVEIYPSSIEIANPGVFPNINKIDDLMSIRRFARNPNIARVCTELGFGQELGEGIKRIVTEMRKYGYIDPVYQQFNSHVVLQLKAIARLSDELIRMMPKGAEAVYNVIRTNHNGVGTGEIMEILEMTRPTVTLRLKSLEQYGLVRHVGKSHTDPRAYWIANNS